MKATHQFALFAALVGALAACGEPDKDGSTAYRDPAETPRYADADRDGSVTREEASVDPALAARFERYDANGNGKLERAEFARLEAGATSGSQASGNPESKKEDEERHTLRPRREFPRPLD